MTWSKCEISHLDCGYLQDCQGLKGFLTGLPQGYWAKLWSHTLHSKCKRSKWAEYISALSWGELWNQTFRQTHLKSIVCVLCVPLRLKFFIKIVLWQCGHIIWNQYCQWNRPHSFLWDIYPNNHNKVCFDTYCITEVTGHPSPVIIGSSEKLFFWYI